MRTIKVLFYLIMIRLKTSLITSVEYSKPHAFAIGLVGVFGFPLYYWIWNDLFPQPYENLTLRLIGSMLFLGFAFIRHWPSYLQPYIPIYWLIIMLYGLSFFFTFMLLMNQGNIVWAMSTMAGLSLLILVAYDWALVIFMYFFGSLLALSVYFLESNALQLNNFLIQLPIYLFLIFTGSIFNYKSVQLKQEKLKVLAAVGAEISHELRTPLMTIHNHAHGLKRYLPELFNAYELAIKHKLLKQPMKSNTFDILNASLDQIKNEVLHSNTIIDMLLMNLGKSKINQEEFGYFSMADIVTQAIERYPFDSQDERNIVTTNLNEDFQFFGSDLLMMHVLFNLIKNALVFTNSTSEANIEINLKKENNRNCLSCRDNGKGISLKDRLSIFESFYSSANLDKGAGTGIGLAFCKKVLTSFNADITCDSKLGEYTEFTLSFPDP